MDQATIRAWWSNRQALDGRLSGKPAAAVLEQTGWARTVGGAGPYLTLFARAGLGREQVDRDVAELKIHELPAARGCTYVVPASDFALALKAGQPFSGAEMKVAAKLGVTEKEIDKLCAAILKALEKGPLEPEELRAATGKAARSLGPEGVKKGVSTTLPVALGRLQAQGDIRKISVNGRFDQQRYRYALWRPNPLAGFKLSPEEANTELARRFFRWIGPATLAEFQWFSALGVKAAKAAVEPLGLVPLAPGDERWIFPDDAGKLRSFQVPREPQYALVSSVDGVLLLRRDTLIAGEDRKRQVFAEKSYAEAGGLQDLPSHAILDRGRLVGLWEYDPETQSIAWSSFIPRNRDLIAAVERTEQYIRTDLGDARSFSLDSPKSRAPRIQALRKAAAKATKTGA